MSDKKYTPIETAVAVLNKVKEIALVKARVDEGKSVEDKKAARSARGVNFAGHADQRHDSFKEAKKLPQHQRNEFNDSFEVPHNQKGVHGLGQESDDVRGDRQSGAGSHIYGAMNTHNAEKRHSQYLRNTPIHEVNSKLPGIKTDQERLSHANRADQEAKGHLEHAKDIHRQKLSELKSMSKPNIPEPMGKSEEKGHIKLAKFIGRMDVKRGNEHEKVVHKPLGHYKEEEGKSVAGSKSRMTVRSKELGKPEMASRFSESSKEGHRQILSEMKQIKPKLEKSENVGIGTHISQLTGKGQEYLVDKETGNIRAKFYDGHLMGAESKPSKQEGEAPTFVSDKK